MALHYATTEKEAGAPSRLIKRHGVIVRVWHWVNALCLGILLMSGLQIFNAHPALYLGKQSRFDRPLLAISSEETDDGPRGMTRIFGFDIPTTGLLGAFGSGSSADERAFPTWVTLPSAQDLGTGRKFHFLFAWILVANSLLYLASGLISGHLWRDLVPGHKDLASLGRVTLDHVRLRFPKGEEARHYNPLQKLAYGGVVGIAIPVMILAGLAMSPALDSAFPILPALFAGRQTARTVHFVVAFALLAFFVVHIAMVLLTGPFNNMRAMVTGWFDLGAERSEDRHG